MSHAVTILAVPRHYPLDVAIPEHVLTRHPAYRVTVCRDAAGLETADTVIVPGYDEPHRPVPGELLDGLRHAYRRGARIVAVCTGVFAVADAGLLDGRQATTHWRYASQLRELHPRVTVLENRLLHTDGTILTSAGATGGIDVCLAMIRDDFGAHAADAAAKEVVFTLVRGPDEPQFTDAPAGDRASLRATREWVIDRLAEPITVDAMARASHLSRRTFIRRFTQESGMPPMRWVILQRLYAARRLLETSDWPVERVAGASGFGTAANLRAVFRRELGVTPSAHRTTAETAR
ncbi:GlxA family transcriptional regulator [Actinoplanes couchii]|uniref:AraC family transcriptional regulator n=1 Tax=Actinoplanes couchii TaxID=403638 RepID=A0ABQ3XP13_9ACTN|nr:helix-turn-helix domain-containing protein [Actinoplanes couchii]MDR6318650.1 transcriptional regulator GlxA family with amidase domain [Actinoplanes couchii]GID60257.1 AraC family transcriptional regulator [Actinoplanes couchii]